MNLNVVKTVFCLVGVVVLFVMALIANDPIERNLMAIGAILLIPVLSLDWTAILQFGGQKPSEERHSQRGAFAPVTSGKSVSAS